MKTDDTYVRELEKDFEFVNERGSLVQLVHKGYSQVNVLHSFAGTIRGGHMHKRAREAFYIIDGCVEVDLWKKDVHIKKSYSTGDFFEICPMTMHSLMFPKDCVMVALYDIPIESEDGTKDIYTEVEE